MITWKKFTTPRQMYLSFSIAVYFIKFEYNMIVAGIRIKMNDLVL